MILPLTSQIQPYAWGSRTLLPAFLGQPPSDRPQAELWLGAHPMAPSRVAGRSLADLVAEDPAGSVGADSVEAFGPRLPFLMKVLAAAQPLSLQVHPSREQAEQGFAREERAGIPRDASERMYRDDWPKPEVFVALADSEALCGFRGPRETHDLFDRLGAASVLPLVAPLADGTAASLGVVFERLLRLESDRGVLGDVVAAASATSGGPELQSFATTAIELATAYPGDTGVLAALLMNRVPLRPHDALFLPAGNLHAYLHGFGVEIMANSDNVARAGLTPKHVDVDELLKLVDFTPKSTARISPVEEAPGVWAYQTPTPEFAFWRLEAGEQPLTVPGVGSGRIALVASGEVTLAGSTVRHSLRRGESVFLMAGEELQLRGDGTVFLGAPGVHP